MRALRLPGFLIHRLSRHFEAVMLRRPPDRDVRDTEGRCYLQRWYLYRRRCPDGSAHGPAVYLHRFTGSDIGRLHDHPWPSLSLVLRGGYIEHVPADARFPAGPTRPLRRRPGDLVLRRARDPHRVEVPADAAHPVLSLFLVGRRRRRWGFWCPQGWRDGPVFKRTARQRGDAGAGCE